MKTETAQEKQAQRNLAVKQAIIKACRTFLQDNKYEWTEEDSLTTDSYYFHITGDKIASWQTPVIRISDHISNRGKYRLAEFIVTDFGKNTHLSKIKNRVYKELNKGFAKNKISKVLKAFENLNK